MYRDYKLYYGESYVCFSSKPNYPGIFSEIIRDESEKFSFLKTHDFLFTGERPGPILICDPAPGALFCHLMENARIVIAGGGVVFNEEGKILFIHRRAHWDLPKGKIEINEDIRSGAKREIEEETGATVSDFLPVPDITYHSYRINGINYFKETHWFQMFSTSAQTELKPQEDEDITAVQWLSKDEYTAIRNECYPLIRDLADRWFERK
jgi:8-oxo-dGTP pyrophosphatase MutT (NUDIX family)